MEDRNPFDTVDGFTIDEEVSPFKILSREDLNKIDKEPKEETIEEPKKVISKKSAPPPTSNDDDLSAIIDDWD